MRRGARGRRRRADDRPQRRHGWEEAAAGGALIAAKPPPRPLPRLRFFAGKGGVGKTTCAAAAALARAESGGHVLVISTDPAHSLGDALGTKLAAAPRAIATRGGALWAVELDADRALERWLRPRRDALELIASRGTYLDDEDLERIFRLSLPGVDELVGLLEITRLARARPYDEVLVDTAPAGHTLRLLAMPETLRRIATVFDDMAEKHRVLEEALGRGHRRDRTDDVIDAIDREGEALHELLRSADRAAFAWVLLPEVLSLEEAKDGVAALGEDGMLVSELIVNRITTPPGEPCALCQGRVREERAVIAATRSSHRRIPLTLIPAVEEEPRGARGLRTIARAMAARDRGEALSHARLPPRPSARRPRRSPAKRGIDAILPASTRLLLFGGKGGVGKTTCAAAAAIAFADAHPDARVLLLSVDPMHSLGDALGLTIGDRERGIPGGPPRLRVRELDAQATFARHREDYAKAVDEVFDRVMGGSRFDPVHDRAVVRDLVDLAPPGMDELFALLAVIDALVPRGKRAPRFDRVVLDTAPSGHTLRLLALPSAALEWVHAILAILLKYRTAIGLGDVARDLLEVARELKALQAILHDAARASFVTVTRAAELPLLENERLVAGLARLGISAPVRVVNARTPPGCRRCEHARRREEAALARQRSAGGARPVTMQAPALAAPPRGLRSLRSFAATWTMETS